MSNGGRHHDQGESTAGRRFARGERDSLGSPRSNRPGRNGHIFGNGGHGQHGKHRLGRFFAHGDLRVVVLSLIASKPSHGYEIIKAIEEKVCGAYSPSPGVIYPTLTLLEELGYVTVSLAGTSSRKLYEITPEGKSYLAANRKTLETLRTKMDETGRSHRSGAAPQIVHAIENLKHALRSRLSNGPLSDEQVNLVATAIDAAATAVAHV